MASRSTSTHNVQAQVDLLRRNLLDLSLRNRMLNYRPSKRLSVEICNEDSLAIFKLLVQGEKRLSLSGVLEAPVKKGAAAKNLFGDHDEVAIENFRKAAEEELDTYLDIPQGAIEVAEKVAAEKPDKKLQINEPEGALQTKLRTIQREAKSANDELGINTLFLTLGTLLWDDGDGRASRAPLLFIPVKLDRLLNGSLRLSHDGTDVGANLPLKAKLAELNLALPEFGDENGLAEFFDEVEANVQSRPNWTVERNSIHLAFFNYEKYSMYMDLGGELWPTGAKPWDNPDLRAILCEGYDSPDSEVDETTSLDEIRPVQATREVFDADGSQLIAMIRASEGHSIVVEGPPGTGKSQTITNIIAEAVAAGKTVLFVSAKRAALEVVKRNLERADLGPMCLDLHDKLTNRREFYSEIKKTVEKSITARSEDQKVNRLTELRGRLNSVCLAVNETLPAYEVTPFLAMAELARLPKETVEDRDGRIPFATLQGRTHIQINESLLGVRTLQQRVLAIGIPREHPFWGCEIDFIDPSTRLDLEEDLRLAISSLENALELIQTAARSLQVDHPANFDDVKVLRACFEQAFLAPPHEGVPMQVEEWRSHDAKVREVIEGLKVRTGIRQALQNQVRPEIWSASLQEIATAFEQSAGHWYKFMSGSYRSASQSLESFLTPQAPQDPLQRRDLVHQVQKVQAAEVAIRAAAPIMTQLFGVQWNGVESDPAVIERISAWITELHRKVVGGQLPQGLLDLLEGNHADPALRAHVEAAEAAALTAQERYLTVVKLLKFPVGNLGAEPITAISKRTQEWADHLFELSAYVSYSEAREAVFGKGLESVVEVADTWPLAGERLTDSFLRSYLSGVVREAVASRPALKSFDRISHEAAIEEFKALDDFKLQYNRAQVRIAHQLRIPTFEDGVVGNLRTLKLQCELQRKHRPIRWIMSQAGEAIQRIKPVFMMSPLSVAVHLPPELPRFDMVIFDEASQIKPEDALCAIARAKQSIVVGDTRQMPPTNFFTSLTDQDEDEEEGDGTEVIDSETRKLESILSLMSAVTVGKVRRPDLRWHYRSLHPSLIQPSNEMFYENRLIVFPSPSAQFRGRRVGVVFHHHPETVYESGAKNRVNRQEAVIVADAVLEHISTTPDESLLVATINKPQADLLYEELQKRERANPITFAAYRNQHPHEPLDVKNLENVQGDERDVVFVSVTYGRDQAGVLRQQFGPLLLDGGERRLNVLITRARKRCEIFSNMVAEDIKGTEPRPGVDSLKRYLKFAETGSLSVPTSQEVELTSPFEEEVSQGLQEKGYELHAQIGSEGYKIDLGVVDPDAPGTYILGIECDGQSYESARTARDRDKLRERILESRGWNLHRIWSHDWWQDRDGEMDRLFQAIDAAKSGRTVTEVPAEEAPSLLTEAEHVSLKPPQLRPYVEASTPISKDPGMILEQIVREEGPIEAELLRVRLKAATGITRETSTVRAHIDSVFHRLQVKTEHTAYYWDETQLLQPRDWSTRPTAEKKADLVPHSEIMAALRAVAATAYGIQEHDAVKAAFTLIGFKRVSDSAGAKGAAVLRQMIEDGALVRREGNLLFLGS